MIRPELFIGGLARAGFQLFSGTPCSYLTSLINTVIDSHEVHYIAAANEGNAVAMAAGADLGGCHGVALFQNSGLGNAVNPLTSLTATFRIPVLLIITWRGEPGGPADEPQHELMGRITPGLLELMGIPWEVVPPQEEAVAPLLRRALDHLTTAGTPYALIVRKETFGPHALRSRAGPGSGFAAGSTLEGRLSTAPHRPDEVLRVIQANVRPSDVVLATTGYTGRALYALADRPSQLYMVGSMGCVSSLGLGLARVQPQRRVVVIDGDGAMLMRLGALATTGAERPHNLIHVLLDNGVHESTGGQATVSGSADLAQVAQAGGYPRVQRVDHLEELAHTLQQGPPYLTFCHVRTARRDGTALPRPTVTPAQVAQRLRVWLKASGATLPSEGS
jgi:phosphonopyruvate decarboxylase